MNEQEIRQKWKVIEKPGEEKPGFFNGSLRVQVIAEIHDNQSKITHQYPTEVFFELGAEVPSNFMWKDGNFSCDCNRHLFFNYAVGIEPEEDEEDDECTDWKYSVRLVNPVDGKVFYNELIFNDLLK
jgi:hypothetical protein